MDHILGLPVWAKKGDKKYSSYGYGVSGLMRDYLVLAGIPYNEALAYSERFDEQIKTANWLETYDGTTFVPSE